MSDYWKGKPGAAGNLRLLTREGKWLAWEDQESDPNDPSSKRIPGAKSRVNEMLTQAVHATNVLTLLGSGASFSAKNAGPTEAPGMGDLWHSAREKVCENELIDHSNFDNVVLDAVGSLPPEENGKQRAGDIENLLSLCKMKLELMEVRAKDNERSDPDGPIRKLKTFIEQAEGAILAKVDFVDQATDLPAHRGLIQKFAKRAVDKPRVKVFTTNYDLCVEEAASRLGVVLIDGFSHSAEQRFNRDYFQHDLVRRQTSGTKADYIDGVFHLYKLHGSIDWRRRSDGVVIRSRAGDPALKPVLIYPRSTKYQEAFETPYLDMFAAFQAALREPDTALLIAGFGFADDHISAPIWSALESNLSLRLILVDPSFIPPVKLDAYPAPDHLLDVGLPTRKYQNRMARLVAEGDPRVTLLNGRFEDLVDAIPAITGESDRQRLQMRLDQIRDVAI
ncbi:SIR2 family protein [Neorhizobium galegae]|uniref:SIR2-like domain protein n=1 Tax=Neorhizobium galegae bv. orientalis str. HAMBI 540 TaxID=1028800 RepID=A0A068SL62_NEOGA|nr:SIR2 family protein [Neorhizobium galegae]CDN46549.1 SIR2-like domain protein [Neorhizobium galegae bv. orientalis str. HAMBI 540]